jgi:hypothetical protein
MKDKLSKKKTNQPVEENGVKNDPEGYPVYPDSDDIYGKFHKEGKVNPEDTSKLKDPVGVIKSGMYNEKDFDDDVSGSDLDIPGSELDDELEFIGSEDEENNYYSLGDDNLADLEEDDEE